MRWWFGLEEMVVVSRVQQMSLEKRRDSQQGRQRLRLTLQWAWRVS
jgi:hypothetical protein